MNRKRLLVSGNNIGGTKNDPPLKERYFGNANIIGIANVPMTVIYF
jgi:hypothetical protein